MPNAISNFIGGIANGARQAIVDPAVDLGAMAAKGINKGLDLVTGDNLSQYTNPKIDNVAEGMKQQATSKVDPTSMAGAIGEGLSVGIDNAAAALGLVELAKNVGKAGLKKLPKLLGKYQDAKDKKTQLKAAQDIRDYVNEMYRVTGKNNSEYANTNKYYRKWAKKSNSFIDKTEKTPEERRAFIESITNTPEERKAMLEYDQKLTDARAQGRDPELEPIDLYL